MSMCMDYQKRARDMIPGMTQLLSKRPDMFSLDVWPSFFSKASGSSVWDLDGRQYLDMSISGIGANVLGYADPDVDGEVKLAIDKGVSSSLNCPEDVELAELLCSLHPSFAEMVRYTRSGGEAMAVAVRIARAKTRRDVVVFCGYHGWHDWYLAANVGTENALGEHLIPGLAPNGVPKGLAGTSLPFRFNCIEELEALVSSHGRDLAAIVLEPIRDHEPTPDFVEAVRFFADETGAVLIIDEISSGFRLNSCGAHVLFGYRPDMAVFSKAMGNGYPIAAVVGKASVMEAAQESFISSTCWTERVGPTAALATIRKHARLEAAHRLISLGKSVQEGWAALLEKHGIRGHVGGMYPMSHFQFDYPDHLALKAYFVQLMLDQDILASTLFYAMWAHRDEDVARYLEACDKAFSAIGEALSEGNVLSRLRGHVSVAGFHRLT
ncbi:MAG: aminotransferase class III-fold pyridoxal phosphate-dependent enzyme [Synergistaceae bacterium]|nr:aminotransferase class III-fold pyridoxal phosphate-dependent enzyme [Synergistaceae bacterium]